MTEEAKTEAGSEERSPNIQYDVRPIVLSRWRRIQVAVIGWVAYAAIRCIAPTIRFEILGWQHVDRIHAAGRNFIYTFWHRVSICAAWVGRNQGTVVMNSTNFDGQWTRRAVERLGFGTAQGSSTRGGLRGLVEMARHLEAGRDVAFTIDGPRGPRYVAKQGPAMLARKTGCPIVVFHFGVERAHTLEKTWDQFQIPKLFTRAVMFVHAPIEVPADADREAVQQKHAEMQKALEQVRDLAESWFSLPEEERKRLAAEWNA
jgi:hypothetical protein